LGTLAPDRLSALRRVATIESIGSSTRIEGSKLSDREVERLLSNLAIQNVFAISARGVRDADWDGLQGAIRSQWLVPLARIATRQTAQARARTPAPGSQTRS
jgi:hypothetical protein